MRLYTAELPHVPLQRSFDVVVANIYADILIAHASSLVHCVSRKPDSRLILSGILSGQAQSPSSSFR